MVGLSFAMAFALAAISSVCAPVFWGINFTKSWSLIALLVISIPFSTIASIVRNQNMIPNGHDQYYSYSIIAGAVVSLVINYLLIPKYQATGVTIGIIIAEIVVCLFELWFVRSTYNYKQMLLKTIVYILSSFVMFFVVRLIGNLMGLHVYTLVVQVICGILAFTIITIPMLFAIRYKDQLV